MQPISVITGRIVALPVQDIDTDQIIPARYLKVTDKSGLAEGLFYAWRFDADGKPNPDFVLNRPETQGATILVAGRNFGCGSSTRTCSLGAAGVRVQGSHQSLLRRHFPQQCTKERLADRPGRR
jgi:3-isopropylmalate dehydratase small subunit